VAASGTTTGVKATTLQGTEITIEQKALDAFRTRLRLPLLLSGEPGYDESRALWNAMIDRRPALVARCLGIADVIASVNFAREQGIVMSIKGGGHNIAGLAACDGGLMLDMSAMRGVWVDTADRIARAQPGCLLGDVDRETQVHGLAAVLGFVSATGVAGLTLGGGFGYLTRRFGWTSDNVRTIELVTAEGRVVRASEKENGDLFWGLRGGGGNFGVVTGIDYQLHAVGPEIFAGAIAWPGSAAREVLDLWRTLVEDGPPELSIAVGLRPAPPAPWLPKEIHGKPIIALFVCDTGPVADAERRVAKIKSFGSPVGDIVQRRPYASQQSLLDATQPKGRRYYWKSEYVGRLAPAMLDGVVKHAERIVSPHSAVILFPINGALTRLPDEHSAVGNRTATVALNIAASWEKPADDAANIEWTRTAWQELRQFSTGGTYINFLTEEDGEDRIRAAYGDNLERLVEIKTKWDPGNLFRANKNIAPGAT
jgi:FAD/FMN-containing dehydrogenase